MYVSLFIHRNIDKETLRNTPVLDAIDMWQTTSSSVRKVDKFDPTGSWYFDQAWWNPFGDLVHYAEEPNGRCLFHKNMYPLKL